VLTHKHVDLKEEFDRRRTEVNGIPAAFQNLHARAVEAEAVAQSLREDNDRLRERVAVYAQVTTNCAPNSTAASRTHRPAPSGACQLPLTHRTSWRCCPLCTPKGLGKGLSHNGFQLHRGVMGTGSISTRRHVDGLQLRIVSFGFGHGPAPSADLVLDLRERFRDPHVSPHMRKLTGHDPKVIAKVLSTRGVGDYIDRIFTAITALVDLELGTVILAAGCTGGRHRGVVVADQLFLRACAVGWTAQVLHRDIEKDVLAGHRPTSTRTTTS
jgi:hypothetical protein